MGQTVVLVSMVSQASDVRLTTEQAHASQRCIMTCVRVSCQVLYAPSSCVVPPLAGPGDTPVNSVQIDLTVRQVSSRTSIVDGVLILMSARPSLGCVKVVYVSTVLDPSHVSVQRDRPGTQTPMPVKTVMSALMLMYVSMAFVSTLMAASTVPVTLASFPARTARTA